MSAINPLIKALQHRQNMTTIRENTTYWKKYYFNRRGEISNNIAKMKKQLGDTDYETLDSSNRDFHAVLEQYKELYDAVEAQELIAETAYLTEMAKSYFIAVPDENDQEIWKYVPVLKIDSRDDLENTHISSLFPIQNCLTLKGVGVVRAAIRKELKERADFLQVHMALFLSTIAAIFGLTSFIVAALK